VPGISLSCFLGALTPPELDTKWRKQLSWVLKEKDFWILQQGKLDFDAPDLVVRDELQSFQPYLDFYYDLY